MPYIASFYLDLLYVILIITALFILSYAVIMFLNPKISVVGFLARKHSPNGHKPYPWARENHKSTPFLIRLCKTKDI